MDMSVEPQDGWMGERNQVDWIVCMTRCMNRRGTDEVFNFFMAMWWKYEKNKLRVPEWHDEYAKRMTQKAHSIGAKRVAELVRKMPRVNDHYGRCDAGYWKQSLRDQIVEAGIDWVDLYFHRDEYDDPDPNHEVLFIENNKLQLVDGKWYFPAKRTGQKRPR